jgi:kynurenine formamidase
MKIVRVVDLSREITAETQVYPGDPVPHIAQHATIAVDGFNLVSVAMGSQSGTHVDAPFHFDNDTEKIDEIPLARFVGRGVVLRCDGVSARERITLDSVRSDAETVGAGDIVLVHTGWARHYGDPSYFDNPFLDAGLVSFLLDRGVRTIGLDALKNSTLLKKFKAGDLTGAALEFPKWNKSKGKVLPGLVIRRAAERHLFECGS